MQPWQAEKWASLALFFMLSHLGLVACSRCNVHRPAPNNSDARVEKTDVLDDDDFACCGEPVAS
jgi:hypothetical protein